VRIKEVAINWSHVDGSKVGLLTDSFGMLCNIIQIGITLNIIVILILGKAMKMFSNEGPLIALSSLVLGQTALIVAFLLIPSKVNNP